MNGERPRNLLAEGTDKDSGKDSTHKHRPPRCPECGAVQTGNTFKHEPTCPVWLGVCCVELAPHVDLPVGAPNLKSLPRVVNEAGWTLIPFTVETERPDCLALVSEPDPQPMWLVNAYDGEAPGWFHGTDCALSRWVARGGLGEPPDCQRLAAGGYFRTINLYAGRVDHV